MGVSVSVVSGTRNHLKWRCISDLGSANLAGLFARFGTAAHDRAMVRELRSIIENQHASLGRNRNFVAILHLAVQDHLGEWVLHVKLAARWLTLQEVSSDIGRNEFLLGVPRSLPRYSARGTIARFTDRAAFYLELGTGRAHLGLCRPRDTYLAHPDFVALRGHEPGFAKFLAKAMRSWANRRG